MEKHIFKFGNSSVAIILPKKWVDKNKLKAADQIFMSENNKGDLVLSGRASEKSAVTKDVNKNTDPEVLKRLISIYYRLGIGRLHIRSKDGFTRQQIEAVQREIGSDCPGFEVISQSSGEMQIEDLTDIKEIEVEKIISRLRSLVLQEFIEVRDGKADTVENIEGLVDRFHMLGVRYVSITQPSDIIRYYRTIILIEGIADDLARISSHLNKGHEAILDRLRSMFERSERGFMGDQREIVEMYGSRLEAIRIIDESKLEGIYKRILKNIANSSAQIAEFGLVKEDESMRMT